MLPNESNEELIGYINIPKKEEIIFTNYDKQFLSQLRIKYD